MFDADYEKEVALIAQRLWLKGEDILHWSITPSFIYQPWADSWADVYIEKICSPLNVSWLATVVSLNDKEDEGYGYFKVPYDGELILHFSKDQVHPIQTTLVSQNGPLLFVPVRQEEIEDASYWNQYRQEKYRVQNKEAFGDVSVYKVPVWTIDKISAVIKNWLKDISGYSFKLEMDTGLVSPLQEQAVRAMEEIKARGGGDNLHDLGDGLVATDQAMDSLLEDPHAAAEITEKIKKFPS